MFNLGIISNAGENSNHFEEVLKQHQYRIMTLNVHNYLEEINKVDAVIIKEDTDIAQTCRFILDSRNNSDALIYVYSMDQSDNNRYLYLQLGADGVCKEGTEMEVLPILLNNAIKRMKSKKIIRKIEMKPQNNDGIKNSTLEMIPENFSVLLNGYEEVNMTKLEYIILDALYRNAGKAMSYKEIANIAWRDQESEIQKYRVANVIFHVREKIEKKDSKIQFIKTIRSKGYMLDAQALDG
ncbi:hypothetical protein ATZ33_16930 [Enterococcus silesiacus]|uniref:OmpR/PhoB-type domain-containing protein n=1 Tax=Enterococcus silesiacus TaxID=332949 RepID=A0A0S3KG23_9ENTE|nr:winged helix-turn-helix domain-containing protein [Enterococcus silesiacus]ALS03001.1 hypothetical protein ATZ33_16930 [Enterococcus silesiacus]OJG92943.1 hypothetical protein RV15_GL002077 [Enterococcus silesiacus]